MESPGSRGRAIRHNRLYRSLVKAIKMIEG